MSQSSTYIPELKQECELLPIDSSSLEQKYILKLNESHQFEVSEHLYRFIKLIDGKKNIDEIAKCYSQSIGKICSEHDVRKILEKYLLPTGALITYDKDLGLSLPSIKKTSSYLYLRIPLFSQRLLEPITNILKYLYSPSFFYSALGLITIFHFMFYLIFDKPSISFIEIGADDVFFVYLLIFITTLFHELGHSAACKYYNAKHGSIGVGLYIYFPVFYADVTDVWKLNRTQRAIVDFGGMYFQLYFVPIYYFLFLISDNLVFLYSVYAINFSLVSQLNPLLRFDGYWLASDIAGVPNLRKRSQKALKYLFKKLKFWESVELPSDLYIRSRAKIFLFSYSILSNIFFGFFIYHIIKRLPEILYAYPTITTNFLSAVVQSITTLEFSEVWESFSEIFFPTLMLFMASMVFYRLIKNFVMPIINKYKTKHAF